jgi:hypothetical protein
MSKLCITVERGEYLVVERPEYQEGATVFSTYEEANSAIEIIKAARGFITSSRSHNSDRYNKSQESMKLQRESDNIGVKRSYGLKGKK